MTRRRDQMLKDQGKLPPDHLAGTGPIPGTDNERPKAHQGTPRVRDFETDPFASSTPETSTSGRTKLTANPTSETSNSKSSKSFKLSKQS